jgi:hypothetical protein
MAVVPAQTWVRVIYDSSNTSANSSNLVLAQCAKLLSTNEAMPYANFINLLDTSGNNQHLEDDGTGPIPLYYVYAWSPSAYDPTNAPQVGTIALVMAFYKSIRRSNSAVSTLMNSGSVPRQRWWSITIGCQNPTPAPASVAVLYKAVRQEAADFFNNVMPTLDSGTGQPQLVILDDADRVPNPTTTTADQILVQFLLDVTVGKRMLHRKSPFKEPVYGAFSGTYLTGWEILGSA